MRTKLHMKTGQVIRDHTTTELIQEDFVWRKSISMNLCWVTKQTSMTVIIMIFEAYSKLSYFSAYSIKQ